MALKLDIQNPYSVGFLVDLGEPSTQILKRTPIDYEQSSINDKSYTLKRGDRLWQIALDFYGNSKWYWVLIDVNDIENPFDLPIGIEILIPDIQVIKALI